MHDSITTDGKRRGGKGAEIESVKHRKKTKIKHKFIQNNKLY